MASTNTLGSRRPFNCLFSACRLLICTSCLLIVCCHCLEFLDNLASRPLISPTLASMPEDVAYALLCLMHPPNIETRHHQNLVNVSSSREDCIILQAMATSMDPIIYVCTRPLVDYGPLTRIMRHGFESYLAPHFSLCS